MQRLFPKRLFATTPNKLLRMNPVASKAVTTTASTRSTRMIPHYYACTTPTYSGGHGNRNNLLQPLPQSRRDLHTRHSQEKRHLVRKQKRQKDPFRILGLSASEKISYTAVKQLFIKIAMQHHPDTTSAETEEERNRHRDIFMQARKAFEDIVEGPDGMAVVRSDDNADNDWDDDSLNEWFQQESGGFDMPFMDVQTRKEVSRVMEEMGSVGLDRDGGMWTLARMVANDVKQGGDGASLLRLESGDVRNREVNGILRRKRKR
jgi:hypothetical protein